MRVLVTGAAGFVGKHLCDALVARDDEVIPLDKKTGTDLADYATAMETIATAPVDVIVHLAATCSTSGSIRDPMTTFRDTVMTAVNVMEAARKAYRPVILTSSVKARDGTTPYGAAKRMAEWWALDYGDTYGFDVVVNRPGTIYGPGQEGSTESGWIAWFCKAKEAGVPVIINGSGDQVRDLLHVSDYVRLLLMQIDDPERYSRVIWDVGGGEKNAVTVNQIADHLGLVYSHGPERHGDAARYIGENDAPNWEPLVDWRTSETLGGE